MVEVVRSVDSESDAPASAADLLGLAEVRYVGGGTDDDGYHRHIVSALGCAAARRAQRPCAGCRIHDIQRSRFVDLPHRDRPAIVELRLTRLCCADGQRRCEVPPVFSRTWRMTGAALLGAAASVLAETRTQVAARFGIDRRKVARLAAEVAKAAEESRRAALPRVLSLDDLHLGGGTAMVATDPETRRLVDLVPGQPNAVFEAWLARQPGVEQVTTIVMDLDGRLRAAVRRSLPAVTIVADRFHVERLVVAACLEVRRTLLGRRAHRLEVGPTGRRHDGLNRLLKRHWSALKPTDQHRLEHAFTRHPLLGRAYVAKEAFSALYNLRDPAAARAALDVWLRDMPLDLLPWFQTARATIGTHWRPEVLAYFRCRVSNGYTEALNRQIRWRERLGRSGSDIADLRLWALARYDGLDAARLRAALRSRLGLAAAGAA